MTNLEAVRGDDIRVSLTVQRNGSVVDVTGATFTLSAKRWLSDSDYVFQTSDFIVDAGDVIITIPQASTDDFTDTISLNYDVEMVESNGLKTTVARGILKIWADVSR